MTPPDPTPQHAPDAMLARATGVVQTAAQQGLATRLIGGVAIYSRASERSRAALGRSYGDFDLVAPAKRSRPLRALLGQCDHRWTVDSIRPWVLSCIELFGVDRCCFGTNWPVDRLFSSYTDVVDAYRDCIADFSESERDALMFANAARMFTRRTG
jgi:hypothetical protein